MKKYQKTQHTSKRRERLKDMKTTIAHNSDKSEMKEIHVPGIGIKLN